MRVGWILLPKQTNKKKSNSTFEHFRKLPQALNKQKNYGKVLHIWEVVKQKHVILVLCTVV